MLYLIIRNRGQTHQIMLFTFICFHLKSTWRIKEYFGILSWIIVKVICMQFLNYMIIWLAQMLSKWSHIVHKELHLKVISELVVISGILFAFLNMLKNAEKRQILQYLHTTKSFWVMDCFLSNCYFFLLPFDRCA